MVSPPTRTVGVLDLGSNTFHLCVAAVGGTTGVSVLADARESVRLIAPLQTRHIDPRTWDVGMGALRTLLAQARRFPDAHLRGVATSAIRDAHNGGDFVAAAQHEHGIPIAVLDPEEEARLVYAGARSALPTLMDPVLVVDVGGGSVQLAVGRGDTCLLSRSLPLGVLRVRQRYVPADGVMRAEHSRAIAQAVLAETRAVVEELRAFGVGTMVLASGTARALWRLAMGVQLSLRAGQLSRRNLLMLGSLLAGRSDDELFAMGVEPARRDTLGPGAVVVATLMGVLEIAEAHVSPRGLREGVLLGEAARR